LSFHYFSKRASVPDVSYTMNTNGQQDDKPMSS